jgi:hypothetical protein
MAKNNDRGMQSCRLCNTKTSSHKNDEFYRIIELGRILSEDDGQKPNYLMKLALITIESASGCATDSEHIIDAINQTRKIFDSIENCINK